MLRRCVPEIHHALAQDDPPGRAIEALRLGEAIAMADYIARFAPEILTRQARRDLIELENFRFVRISRR